MSKFLKTNDYQNYLSLKETQEGIKLLKDSFEEFLSSELSLTRVSAPLFVLTKSGLNDNLNGVEIPVSFNIPDIKEERAEIVHSLAKWKRIALKKYEFIAGEGLYTDMNAIRKDEELDNIHSIYVDQWDWEMIITKEERNVEKLKNIVNKAYNAFKRTEQLVIKRFPKLIPQLPEQIFFITTQELEDMYPTYTPKQREDEIAKKYKAIFIMQVGKFLKSGSKHDNRAPDYDDWELNGDILFWSTVLNQAIELSSMGIRVDEKSLKKQLEINKCEDRLNLDYHKKLMNGELPYTIGGGIGQSRLCMYFLQKAHIGEVQASLWDIDTIEACKKNKIVLL